MGLAQEGMEVQEEAAVLKKANIKEKEKGPSSQDEKKA